MTLALLGAAQTRLVAQPHVAEVYTVDQAHSLLDFTTRLLGFNRARGAFTEWRADFVYDPANPVSGYVAFVAEVKSVATQEEERDRDLRAPPFFDANRFPTITFEGRVVAAAGTRFDIEGRLTIRDSTRTIRFPMQLIMPEARDPFGNRRLAFAGQVTLNRRDFGVLGPRFWEQAVADSVSIEIEMAGRIWDYRKTGLRAGYASAIVAAADSGKFDEAISRVARDLPAEQDTVKLPHPFETEIAVGRLAQSGKLREALRVLELFGTIADNRWSAPARSGYETRMGELLLRLGRGDEARKHFDRAIAIDPNNTNARAWRASANLTP